MKIQLFGQPMIFLNHQEVVLARRKSRAVLYYIADSNRSIHRDQLISIFWPDLPRPSALQTLRTTLYSLKKSLGQAIAVQGDQISITDHCEVDTRLFVQELRGTPPTFDRLKSVLGSYRGDFLEGFTMAGNQMLEDWLSIQREYYRRQAIRGWVILANSYESQADYRSAVEALDRALAFDALQEDLHRDSMRLQYLAGDRPGAIRKYDELRKLLDQEMGVPPMAETRAQYDAIITDRIAFKTSSHKLPAVTRLTQPPPAKDDLPLIGREKEMLELARVNAPGILVVLEGEPGIGKTRLAEEFLLTLSGISLVGRARELEQNIPYSPMIQILRRLTERSDWPEIFAWLKKGVASVWLNEMSRLLPDIGLSETGSEFRQPDEARLWEAVHQVFDAIARRTPLNLFIDDLNWADNSTLGLCAYLLRQTDQPSIRYLATARVISLKNTAGRLWQTLMRENRMARISLDRLNADHIRILANSLTVSSAQPLAEWLFRISEGNPYILAELIRYIRHDGILNKDGQVNLDALNTNPVVPQTVYSLIESRLANLSGPARRVLDAAVAQGREFEFEITARAAGLSENAALDALDELQESGLIFSSGQTHFSFDHSLTLEVAYREIGDFRHRMLHRRVAEAMESIYVHRANELPQTLPAQLATQFLEGNQPVRAAPYAVQAGRQAASLAAWDEAARFYETALQGLIEEEHLPVLIDLSEALGKSGDYPRATQALSEALTIAKTNANSKVTPDQIKLLLARSMLPQARFAEVVEMVESVCGSDQPESILNAQLLWGTVLSIEGADLEGAKEHLLSAETLWMGSAGGDPVTLAQIKFELGGVTAQQGDLRKAVEYYRDSLAISNQAGQDKADEQSILAYNNLAYHLHLLKDPEAASFANKGLSLAQEKGVVGLQTYLRSTLGEIALASGELDDADTHFRLGQALAEQFSIPERIAGITANMGLVAAARNQPTIAVHYLSKALGEADHLGTLHLAAQIRLWLVPLLPEEEARKRLDEARRIALSSGRGLLLAQIEKLQAIS